MYTDRRPPRQTAECLLLNQESESQKKCLTLVHQVIIDLKQDVKCRGLKIRLLGQSRIHWHSGSGDNRTDYDGRKVFQVREIDGVCRLYMFTHAGHTLHIPSITDWIGLVFFQLTMRIANLRGREQADVRQL